ncbi:MAG: gamma-glutamylcyclotransferase family protein [Rhizomicrobium sp.]
MSAVEKLFSYGTLREEAVQRAVFGRPVPGTPDAILGYRLVPFTIRAAGAIAISGHADHTILDATGDPSDRIEGLVLALTPEDLARADAYEDAGYKRVKAELRSGAGGAWVYVRA